VLAVYAAMISILNTAAGPLLLDAAPREYLGRVLAVFSPVNQLVSSLWLASTALRSFQASAAGISLNAVSLIFILAGCLIIAAGVRALIALPPGPAAGTRGPRPPDKEGIPGTRKQPGLYGFSDPGAALVISLHVAGSCDLRTDLESGLMVRLQLRPS